MTLSSEWTTIRNNAVTLLQGISGIGNVYGYLRYEPEVGRLSESVQGDGGIDRTTSVAGS